MRRIFKSRTTLDRTFEELHRILIDLETAWTSELERSGLQHATADARHHLCAAIAALDALPATAGEQRAHAVFEYLDDGMKVLAREAYLSAIALGQYLQRAWSDVLASPAALERATSANERMLDELAPYVSRADGALRRAVLDEDPVEAAAADLRRVG
jgi:hypothetical protein